MGFGNFHFVRPSVSLIGSELFQGWLQGKEQHFIQVGLVTTSVVTSNSVYIVIACLSWKQHATVNYAGPKGYKM